MPARYAYRHVAPLTAFVVVTTVAIAGCGAPEPETPPPPEPQTPTIEQVRGATIKGVYDDPVTLKDGVYEGPPFVEGGASRPRVQLIGDLVAFGNLDGATGDEAAAMLSESSGGSGERIYVTVIGMRDGVPTSLGTVEVGDRTKIRTFGISGADVVMEVVEAGPGEPMCCPTQLARKVYGFENGTLTIKNSEVTGTLSIALLAGPEWTVVEIDDTPLPDGAKPPTATFEGERVAGFGGCNRYTGAIKETAPGQVQIGPLAGTMMACPEPASQVEGGFLMSFGKATQYTFLAGRLHVSGMDGETFRSVLFVRP